VVAASAPVLGSNSASPNATTNFVGNTETYTASFTGTLPISYQWQVSPNADGSAATSLTDQTNTTLVLTNLQLANSGYYSLQASNNVSPFTGNSPWTQLVVTSPTNAFIVWSAPVPFLGQSAGQMLTNPAGAYLEAEYFGSSIAPLAVTVGGNIFTFKGDGSSASVVGNIGTASGAWLVGTNTTGNANLDTVLNQFAWDGGIHTITLHNLVIGQQYAVQFFALDNRGGNSSARLTTFQDPNNGGDISAAYTMGTNDYLTGTFTAPSTDVAIQQNVPNGGNINALVVRALSYAPAVQASILTSPASVTAYVGRTIQFNATADGIPTPTLNWQAGPVGGPYTNLVDGGQISGSASGTLTVSGVTLEESGTEFVLFASNLAGSATSVAADLTVLAAPAISGVYSTNILALNPVAYWPFNETDNPDATPNVSTLAAYDASANQHDGLYLYDCYNAYDGIVGPQSTDGYPQFADGQGAMSPLNGVANTWVTAPALNLNTNTVTMVMWVNPAGPQTDYTSLLFTYSAGTVSGMGYSSNQRLGYDWNNDDSGTYNYTAGPVIPENMWSMVAVVVTPTNASFYVINTNGVSSTTYVHNHINMSWNGTETIGSGNNNLGRTFSGVIDEVAVFNYAMTPSQLVALTTTNPPAAPLNLVASAGNAQVTLNWSNTIGEVLVNRSTTNGGPYTLVGSTTGTTYTDTGLLNGTTYYYVVSATNSNGQGPDSSQASATPFAFAASTKLVWSGAVNGNWDIATTNWLANGIPVSYQDGIPVVFDDSVLGNTTVSVSATVSPASVVFSNSVDNYAVSGSAIAGATNSLTKLGSGKLTLSSANTFSGGTTISNGTVEVDTSGNTSQFGTGPVAISGGALTININGNTGNTYDFANNLVLGGGTLNNADGDVHLATGAGATINVLSATTIYRVWGHGNTGKKLNFDGILQGSGGLTLNNIDQGWGEGGGLMITNNANTYSGTITVNSTSGNGMALIVGGNTALQYATLNVQGNGTGDVPYGLRFNPGVTAPVIGALAGNGNFLLADLASATVSLTISNNGTANYSGSISGAGSLTMEGSGTQILGGANTYSGNTTISGGTLLVNGSISANVTVQTNATLGGSGTIGGNVIFNSGASALFTNGGMLAISGNLTASGNLIKLSLSNNVPAGIYTLATYIGGSGTFSNTPSLLSGSFAASTTNYITTGGGHINLVVTSLVNTDAATANFKATVAGAPGSPTMNFTWAPDHLGWQLYTNSVDLTAPGSWFPVPGSGAVTNESISINPAQPKVFFQLRYP
jgi:autotransporter-associated beta strand protein